MTLEAVALALALTGLLFTIAFAIFGFWVVDQRGVDRREWHRPLAAIIGGIAGAFYLAAIWVGALTIPVAS